MTDSEKRVHGPAAAKAGSLDELVDLGEVIGRCPSCGADLHIGAVTDPRSGQPAHALLHQMPFCTYFGETGPNEILRAIGKGSL